VPEEARPTSTAEVAEVLRDAAARGLTVLARGRGTKLSWGLPPTTTDLVVDLSGLDRVLDHQAGDLIVDTQAGAPIAEVQRVVAKEGQRLALDETVPGGSIGGILATNASGPQRVLVGTARDLLIGITVVRADGVVAKAGGRVVKNVAGYDLGKLMIGSFGTLAIITEAVFRLHPLPDVERWVVAPVAVDEQAHRLAQAVVHSQAVPWAVEVDAPADGPGTLAVLVGGRADGVAARAETLRRLLGDAATIGDRAPAGWASYPDGPVLLKLTCTLSGLRDVLAAARDAGLHVRGSAGAGVLHAAGAPDALAALDGLRAICGRHGGTVVVVDAPVEAKQTTDVWGPVPALGLMRRVKDQFDPDHRLAPGRFVGGI
jgi:glycolate oxidase FAD binding subunit